MRKNTCPSSQGTTRHSEKTTLPKLFQTVLFSLLIPLVLLAQSPAMAGRKTAGDIRSTLQTGDLHALVVGISDFRDPRIPGLNLAASDAKAFGEFLETQDKVFKKTRVTYLINSKATKSEIEKHLYYTLPKAGKNDTIILFFSGHGTYDPMRPKDFLFLAYDSEPDYVGTTAVKMTGLDFLKGIEAKRVLIIADACHAGGFSQMKPKASSSSLKLFLQEVRNSSGKAIITSGKGDQLSWEVPNLGHSVFTHNLLEGLKGKADRDRDGVVTLSEVYRYAYGRTKEKTSGHQHPQFEGKVVGAFPLSHIGPPLDASQLKSMLLDAARSGDVRKLEDLFHAMGDVNVRNHDHDSPLIIAARNGNPEVVKLLLAKSADTSLTNNSGHTALIAACAYGHAKTARLLLEAGSHLDAKNGLGFSSMAVASMRGHEKLVELLIIKGAHVQCRTLSGKTPLMLAASGGHTSIVKLLLDNGADDSCTDLKGATALSMAARRGHIDVVNLLLERGARMSTRTGGFREDHLILGILRSHVGRVKESLNRGADIDVETKTGDTPLSLAVGIGNMKVLRLLVSSGALLNRVPKGGSPAIAVAAGYGRPDALQMLLSQGAHPDLTDKEGNTPLMCAARNGRLRAAKMLIAKKSRVNQKNANGCTALMLAAAENRAQVVRLLLEKGADPDLTNREGSTALMIGADGGHLESVRSLTMGEVNPDIQDNKGRTALILATQKGHEAVVKLLIKRESNPHIKDWEGKTAATIASEQGMTELLPLLTGGS